MIFHSGDQPVPWAIASQPVEVLDHHKLGLRYDTDPVGEASLPIKIPEAAEVAGGPTEELAAGAPLPMGGREELPMFVLAAEIPALS